jgi:hypothetical protein
MMDEVKGFQAKRGRVMYLLQSGTSTPTQRNYLVNTVLRGRFAVRAGAAGEVGMRLHVGLNSGSG